jgi:hypothetical protein
MRRPLSMYAAAPSARLHEQLLQHKNTEAVDEDDDLFRPLRRTTAATTRPQTEQTDTCK